MFRFNAALAAAFIVMLAWPATVAAQCPAAGQDGRVKFRPIRNLIAARQNAKQITYAAQPVRPAVTQAGVVYASSPVAASSPCANGQCPLPTTTTGRRR